MLEQAIDVGGIESVMEEDFEPTDFEPEKIPYPGQSMVELIRKAYGEKKIQLMAELLYEHDMRSENWTEIVPFSEVSKEYKQDLISLATELHNAVPVPEIMPTGLGL